MPTTIKIASHPSRELRNMSKQVKMSANQLFAGSCPRDFRKSKHLIQSSFPPGQFEQSRFMSSGNGWVHAAYQAYNNHHHLKVRPEEVWFSILSQVSFYINAHAEELRDLFVVFKGKKELEVVDIGTIATVDFGGMARTFAAMIQENITDPELQNWIMPTWSTTSEDDRVVASMLMMGSMQKYFSYKACCMCGIPSVTLLGERSDWEDMLGRLDKLSEFGKEPTDFAALLRPILRYFIASFDPVTSPAVVDFWTRIAHMSGGSGPSMLSGWLTAFCFWDVDGKCLHRQHRATSWDSEDRRQERAVPPGLEHVLGNEVDYDDVPSGFVSMPIKVDDNGHQFDAKTVAGLVGIQASSSGELMDAGPTYPEMVLERLDDGTTRRVRKAPPELTAEPGVDSVQPLSGWFLYAVKEKKDIPDDSHVMWE